VQGVAIGLCPGGGGLELGMPAAKDIARTEGDLHQAEVAHPVVSFSSCSKECSSILANEQADLDLRRVKGNR
jgi:hypothetical protein